MKYLLLILLTFSLLYAYEWNPIIEENIEIYDLSQHFIGYPFVLACEDGILLENGDEWIQVNSGLPVWNILHYNNNEFLLVQGNGSYSDGIYLFNESTYEFEVIEWIYYPNFLVYNWTVDEYYVGAYNGLYKSSNGEIWEEVTFFNGMNCEDIVFWGNHFAVSVSSNIYGVYCSDDYGSTWSTPVAGNPLITDMSFRNDTKLYGISPDHSNSSGLWSSLDFGASWQIEFYSDALSSVINDMNGDTFVGWEEDQGVAIWSNENVIPMNDGLPHLSINKLFVNPIMSIIHIMAFTGRGAYMLYNYQTSSESIMQIPEINLSNYPNPFNPTTEIRFQISDFSEIESAAIEIYNLKGQRVKTIPINSSTLQLINSITWNGTDDNFKPVSSGVYYYKLSVNGKTEAVRKCLLLK
jgi:hypothetical protein